MPHTVKPARTSRAKARARRGTTLLDVTIAAAVLAIAITSLMSLIVSSITLSRVNHETSIAHEAARRTIEEVQGTEFSNILAVWTANPNFAVRGLTPLAADVDGMVGAISFPTVAGQLREDVVDAGLGMPRDLDGDGVVDAADHSGDYNLLPVRVRLSWRGVSGNRTVDLTTILMSW
jgi:type II secretory pathway pseudopilin PulG